MSGVRKAKCFGPEVLLPIKSCRNNDLSSYGFANTTPFFSPLLLQLWLNGQLNEGHSHGSARKTYKVRGVLISSTPYILSIDGALKSGRARMRAAPVQTSGWEAAAEGRRVLFPSNFPGFFELCCKKLEEVYILELPGFTVSRGCGAKFSSEVPLKQHILGRAS